MRVNDVKYIRWIDIISWCLQDVKRQMRLGQRDFSRFTSHDTSERIWWSERKMRIVQRVPEYVTGSLMRLHQTLSSSHHESLPPCDLILWIRLFPHPPFSNLFFSCLIPFGPGYYLGWTSQMRIQRESGIRKREDEARRKREKKKGNNTMQDMGNMGSVVVRIHPLIQSSINW